jgi:Fe-S oxidoreductase
MNDRKTPCHDAARPLREGLRESLARVRENCTDCGACRDECAFLKKYGTPGEIAKAYDPASPQGLIMPFECSLCKLCSSVCPAGVMPDRMFLEMRREAVESGNGSFPEHKGLLSFERTGMSRRLTYYGLPEGCTTVLFPGCAFPGTRPERTKEIFGMLRMEDPRLGIVLDCCGRISQGLGREAFSRAMIEEMLSYLVDHKVRHVIVICPNCYDMFREYGSGLRVRMIYEVMPKIYDAPDLKKGEVVLHDPCGTRFHTGCHEAVRTLLAGTGVAARDMDHARELTLCCGSGAGADAVSPGLAARWLERTAGETQGRTIATYCAGCARKMGKHSRAVHVLDILVDPETALAGKSPVASAPFTYLNRLRLKGHFKKTVQAAASRERTFRAGEKPKGSLGRVLVLAGIVAAIILVAAMLR